MQFILHTQKWFLIALKNVLPVLIAARPAFFKKIRARLTFFFSFKLYAQVKNIKNHSVVNEVLDDSALLKRTNKEVSFNREEKK